MPPVPNSWKEAANGHKEVPQKNTKMNKRNLCCEETLMKENKSVVWSSHFPLTIKFLDSWGRSYAAVSLNAELVIFDAINLPIHGKLRHKNIIWDLEKWNTEPRMDNHLPTATMPESFAMNGGDGTYSYTKNSHYQVLLLDVYPLVTFYVAAS